MSKTIEDLHRVYLCHPIRRSFTLWATKLDGTSTINSMANSKGMSIQAFEF